jgi:putative ABC transport system permease protein
VPRLLTYSLRSLWARRITSSSTALGVAFLVFVLCASYMLAVGVRATMASSGRTDQALVLANNSDSENGSRLPASLLGQVAGAPGIRRGDDGQPLVTGEVVAHTMMPSTVTPALVSTVQVRGVADNVFRMRPEVRVSEGRAIQPGTSEGLVGRALVGRYAGLRLGDTFELASGRPIRMVGVFESGGSSYESEVWVDLATAQHSLDLDATLSSITAQLERPSAVDDFRATVTRDQRIGLAVMDTHRYFERISFGLGEVVLFLGGILGIIFSLGAVMGAMLTLHASVAQRTTEIGVLLALGFGRRSILAGFLVESVALSLAGAAFGVGFSLLTPLLDFSITNIATNQQVNFRFEPDAAVLLIAASVGLLVGLLGGALPSAHAARFDPVTALRGGAE